MLRWRSVGKQDDTLLVPIVSTIWVSINEEGQAQVTVEYELTNEFVETHPNHPNVENLKILVPVLTDNVHLQDGGNDTVSYELYDGQGVVFNIEQLLLMIHKVHLNLLSLLLMRIHYSQCKCKLILLINKWLKAIFHWVVSITDVVSNNDDEESLPFDLHSNISFEIMLSNRYDKEEVV